MREDEIILVPKEDRQHLSEITSPQNVAEFKPSKVRWYILGLFALMGVFNAAIWNTWGPIAESAKAVFPTWSDGTLAMFTNWGSITCILGIWPAMKILQYNLRLGVLLSGGLAAIGASLRCFPFLVSNEVIKVFWKSCFNLSY